MQQGQQAAEGGGADGSGGAPGVPHQVGQQDVAQELLGLVAKTPAVSVRGVKDETNVYFYRARFLKLPLQIHHQSPVVQPNK